MFKKTYSIICHLPLLFLFSSCTNKEAERELLVKTAISDFMTDEFFQKNMNLNIIEIRINKIELMQMDSLVRQLVTNLVYYPNYSEAEGSPESEALNRQMARFQRERDKSYGSSDIGMMVYVYIKGTYSSKINQSSNLLYKNYLFWVDSKNKILDTRFELVNK